jgi:hypothetical protein
MKYTFLSKWTVLLLTLVTAALAGLGYVLAFGFPGSASSSSHPFYAILALLAGLAIYLVAWIIAVLDSLQERRWGWFIGMLLLLPLWIGPLLYSFFGPRNTK